MFQPQSHKHRRKGNALEKVVTRLCCIASHLFASFFFSYPLVPLPRKHVAYESSKDMVHSLAAWKESAHDDYFWSRTELCLVMGGCLAAHVVFPSHANEDAQSSLCVEYLISLLVISLESCDCISIRSTRRCWHSCNVVCHPTTRCEHSNNCLLVVTSTMPCTSHCRCVSLSLATIRCLRHQTSGC